MSGDGFVPNGRRIRRLIATGKLVAQLLTKSSTMEASQIADGLPEGARLIAASTMRPGSESGSECDLVLLFEHESFEPWAPGSGPAPEQPPIVVEVLQ